MINRVFIVGVLLLTSLLPAVAEELDTSIDTAVDQVTSLHQALNQLNSYADRASAYDDLLPIVTSTHDIDYIARFTLHRSWTDLSPGEQADFTKRFEALSVWLYIDRFIGTDSVQLSTDSMTAVRTPSIRGNRAQVSTFITTDSKEIPLEYSLQQTEDEWRIVNIVADGVSDLALRRSEYTSLIQDSDFEGLITHLDQQIVDLKDAE